MHWDLWCLWIFVQGKSVGSSVDHPAAVKVEKIVQFPGNMPSESSSKNDDDEKDTETPKVQKNAPAPERSLEVFCSVK